MPNALIFGANGFVGGYLARELGSHGYSVVGSDVAREANHSDFNDYRSGNLLDAEGVRCIVGDVNPDVIVNLAAVSSVGQSWKAPALTMQVNVVGTINLLEAARTLNQPPKILLVGSSEEYAPSNKPLKESDSLDATNPYGISKVAQERIAEIYGKSYGLRIYQTRSFNHTGVGQSDRFVIPSWCKQVAEIEKSGKPGVVRVGNIDVVRDFSDVRDIVRAYRMIIESDHAGEIYNVGSGEALALHKILSRIISTSRQPIDIKVDKQLVRPTDNPVIQADISKIKNEIGWQPSSSVLEVIPELVYQFEGRK